MIKGKFNYCYKLITKSDVSHAWIHLHRCVEALARTTGETYSSIFARIEKEFKFDRKHPHKWPDLQKIILIAKKLKDERDSSIQRLNTLIDERKNEKILGKCTSTNMEFLQITKMQAQYIQPKMKPWGWKHKNESE